MFKKIIDFGMFTFIAMGIISIAFIVYVEPMFESMEKFLPVAIKVVFLSMGLSFIFGTIHFIIKGKDIDGEGVLMFFKNNILSTFIFFIFFVIAFFLLLQVFKF